MKIVGVTGGIATGKSTVCKWLAQHRYPIISTDSISHEVLYSTKGSAYQLVIDAFDPLFDKVSGDRDCLKTLVNPETREINRRVLGDLVFSNPIYRKKLESIMHPIIRWKLFFHLFRCFLSATPIVFVEVPLLFEVGWDNVCPLTLVVYM